MNLLVFAGIGIVGLWLQAAVAPVIAIVGIKPNFLLLTLLVLVLRWPSPWLFLYGAAAGLAMDSFSHGALGIYGLSFCLVALAARLAGSQIYDNNLLSSMVVILGLALVEGVLALTILELLDPAIPWWRWLLTGVIPGALYTALVSPAFLLAHEQLERRLHWSHDSWEFRS